MECPKCHKIINDNATVCPHCHKVLTLVCPNCHTLGMNSVCEKCGYIILDKCAKCGRMVSTTSQKCKCGFPVKTSISYNNCESDDFAAITIKFGALKNIRRILASKDLYAKFTIKLKNLLMAQIRNFEGNVIVYDFKKHELFEGEFKNGEKYNGILRTYFDNIDFNLKREIHIKEGKIFGKGKEYYKNNKLKYIGEFKNGEFNGKGTLYYEYSGFINYIGDFINGEKSGEGKEFDIYGNIKMKQNSNVENPN